MAKRTSSADNLGARAGGHGLAEELGDRHALDRLWVLEREEQARLGPGVGRPVSDVLALEEDRPAAHRVGGVAEQGRGQGGLARPVGAHEGVDLAGADDEVEAGQDLGIAGGHVKRAELEERGLAGGGFRGHG